MASLRVDTDGMRLQAGRFDVAALNDNNPTTCMDVSWPASASAVQAAHTSIAAADARCRSRIEAMAAKLVAADDLYVEREADSAARLRAC
jgi:hypothetical protein